MTIVSTVRATIQAGPIVEALRLAHQNGMQGFSAKDLDAALKSAVRAVLPGRQQKSNLKPYLDEARRAFARTLRRKARGG